MRICNPSHVVQRHLYADALHAMKRIENFTCTLLMMHEWFDCGVSYTIAVTISKVNAKLTLVYQ
jgi:hypothetical protein